MEPKNDKEWAVIHRLIEADKENAWEESRNLILSSVPRQRSRHFQTLRYSAAALLLAAIIGIGSHLLFRPAVSPAKPLTFDRLPLFDTLAESASAGRPRSEAIDLAQNLNYVLETVRAENETVLVTTDKDHPGDPEEARANIQRIIRENTLERSINRIITINQEV